MPKVNPCCKRFRADIEGLRAYAIIPVLMAHLGFSDWAGGVIGVDVFFVISGFLITGMLAERFWREDGPHENRFWERQRRLWQELLWFYRRRFWRLAPAAVLMLLIATAVTLTGQLPERQVAFFQSGLAFIGLHANYLFLGQTGYFDAQALTKPLLHTWSLSIEAQFYLVVPFAMLLLAGIAGKRARALWIALTALLCAGSALYMLILVLFRNDAAFYGFLPRFYELGFGGILALLPWRIRDPRFSGFVCLTGLALILGSVFLLTTDQVPGPRLWPCLLGTGCILMTDTGGTRVRFALINPVARFLGRISYSLYLLHWPLIVAMHIHLPEIGDREQGIALAVFIVLAFLSYRFIEQPFRVKNPSAIRKQNPVAEPGNAAMKKTGLIQNGIKPGLALLLMVPVLMVPVAALLWAGARSGGTTAFLSDKTRFIAGLADTPRPFPAHTCLLHDSVQKPPIINAGLQPGDICFVRRSPVPENSKKILVWGDSHAVAPYSAVLQDLKQAGYRIAYSAKGGCSIGGVTGKSDCDARHERIWDWLGRQTADAPMKVLFLFRLETALLPEMPASGNRLSDLNRIELGGFARRLKALPAHIQPFVMEQVPRLATARQPDHSARVISDAAGRIVRVPDQDHFQLLSRDYHRLQSDIRAQMSALDLTFIPTRESYCPTATQCLVYRDGKMLYRDDHHITRFGAEHLRTPILKALKIPVPPHSF